ncbi:MAG TPA: VCBS repeat-containing protein [Ohtaekwangia sp.]|uniref:VCBS repeat-containing protein n=1 Tax=Ohtaekwangia sp. TaxID=2066019 RepID=UPI002F92D0E1
MNSTLRNILAAAFCIACLAGCDSPGSRKKFRLVPSGESGITFRNTLKESVEFNIFNYMYFYNGAGVAVGDVNGDDLPDIYFTSNQEPNKLYINKGNFKFEDVTETAGVEGFNGWTTGVTMADVNSDGRLDIYVSNLGDYLIYKGKNQLFINEGNDANGVPKFSDRAMEVGLDLVGFSTQASFFDYDRDGDLDMFMLNHSLHENGTFGKSSLRYESHPLAGDKLMRNDNGRFIDVTQGSGIYSSVIGYGLGVVVSDVNLDGWPDIYVGNDFHENDYLYINQGNGTFRETLQESMMHTSRYTMGVDFADFNNDAFPDLIAMDMLPEDPQILKASAAEDSYDIYDFKIRYGYNHQFARNTLQLNNHDGTFSEIALLAGVGATDWSWSTLFADFDLDGKKDIFVSNGILRRSNDLDYINFITVDSIQMKMKYDMSEKELSYIEKLPKIKIPNFLFHNNGDSTFTNKALEWGLDAPSYSHGTAYADLDNDGDLDLVINNVEDEAFVYENGTMSPPVGDKQRDKEAEPTPHYLQVVLKGKPGNLQGIGAKVLIYSKGKLQMQECMPTRGFQSSVEARLTFGLGNASVDSLTVIWNDGTFQKINQVKPDQKLILKQEEAQGAFNYTTFHHTAPLLVNAAETIAIPYKHEENKFVEFNREALLPHMLSSEGPASVTGDLNGDGLEDIFLGGAKWKRGHIYLQTPAGTFREMLQPALAADSTFEDVDAALTDVEKDGDLDLVVTSGGNEFTAMSEYRRPRLYINDGKGHLSRSKGLDNIYLTGSCVRVQDVDQDGDEDLFLGARAQPWRYGLKPDSYLLINDGKGIFTDATDQRAPALRKFGFVKQATWADMDGDKVNDLVVAAEWSPVTIFLSKNGKLTPMPLAGSGLENSQGWWNIIQAADMDGDGDLDLIAGNLGLNSRLHASQQQPVNMYVADFDKNDSTDQVLTCFTHGKEYPFNTRDEMTKQMPYLKKRYLSYHKFAEATVQDIFSEETLKAAERFTANIFTSSYIENLGNGKFSIKPLPTAAQFSTVNALLIEDFNHDNKPDILLAGNFYPVNIQMSRYDASYGLLLTGDGKGNFHALPSIQSGFSVKGETRALRKLTVKGRSYYIAVRNNDTIVPYTGKLP